MANASRDENNVPALLAVSSTDGSTPIRVYADPDTHRLLVNSVDGGVTGPVDSTDNGFARWDGTTGVALKNSLSTLDNDGNANFTGTLEVQGAVTLRSTLTADSAIHSAVGYEVGNSSGQSGSFTSADGKTITVEGGIITEILEP